MLRSAVENANVSAVAVGNGTAGRETEAFVRGALGELGLVAVPVVMVSEAGASVYSASDVAREEFPDLDLTIRGAISDRAAAAGSARRAGEGRPEEHRRRPVPARRARRAA